VLILLKAEYRALVRRGEKRSTIRPWRTARGLTVGARCRLGNYADAEPIVITGLERRSLSTLTRDEVRADGFGSVDAFRAAFAALYPAAGPDAQVWVIRFRLDDPAQQ